MDKVKPVPVWEDENLEERIEDIFRQITTVTEGVKSYDSHIKSEMATLAKSFWKDSEGPFDLIKAIQKKQFKEAWEKKIDDLLNPEKTTLHPLHGYVTGKPKNDIYDMALNQVFTPYSDQLKKGIGKKNYLERLNSVMEKNEEHANKIASQLITRDFDATNNDHVVAVAKYLGLAHEDKDTLADIVSNPQGYVGRAYQHAAAKYMTPKADKKGK